MKLAMYLKYRFLEIESNAYIDKILVKYAMQDSKKGSWPFRHGITLSKDQSPKTPEEENHMKSVPYTSAIGSLIYVMLCSRQDIYYAVGIVSRYQSYPGPKHWVAVKHILKCLQATGNYMLVCFGEELNVIWYIDSHFQSDKDSKRSTSSFMFTLGRGAILWRTIKQSYVDDSTVEAEYVAACETTKETIWLHKFLMDLEVVPKSKHAMTLYYDNSSVVANNKEPWSHKRGKYIKRKYHLLIEIIQRRDVIVRKIASAGNLADPFTKVLPSKVSKNT